MTLAQTLGLFQQKKVVKMKAIQSEACGLFKQTRTLFLERHVATEFFKYIFFGSLNSTTLESTSLYWGGGSSPSKCLHD